MRSSYHGVERSATGARCYRVGALLVDDRDPRRVLARTAFPLFGPQGVEECRGVVNNVVCVEAAQVRDGGQDVYYGMADSRVGVLRLTPAKPQRCHGPPDAHGCTTRRRAVP